MKSMTLHQLQQVSNVKEEQDWSEDRTLRHSIANDIDRDVAVSRRIKYLDHIKANTSQNQPVYKI